MKPRIFKKKLVLKKETVAHLNRVAMKNVPAGMDIRNPEETPAGTWTTNCCPTICVECDNQPLY